MKEYNKKKSRLKYISKETMKEYKQELYAVASMVLLAFFYVVTLCCLPQIVPEYFLHSILQWLDYLRYFVCGSFGAFFLIQGFLRLSAWKKKSASIWWFIAAAAFFVNKDILCWWRYKFYVQQMLLLLWPVLVSYAAVYMRKNKPFSVKLIAFESSLCIPLNRCLYYILTVMATWFVVAFLRYSYYDDVNLWNTCYLLLCSAGAWHMAGRKLHEKDKKLSYVVTGILAIAAFACFAVKNSRLLEIVYTSTLKSYVNADKENSDIVCEGNDIAVFNIRGNFVNFVGCKNFRQGA